MIIRAARTDDFTELKDFYFRTNEVINVRNNDFNPDNPVFPSDEMILSAVKNGEQFIGIEDGVIAAAFIANSECDESYRQVKWKVDAADDEFWVLHALRVSPDYEGRGFAKQMITFFIELAAERGLKALRLDVTEGYSVERMYYPFGFEYIGTVEILYEDIGHPRRFRLFERAI